MGPGRERRLWRAGLVCWNELAEARESTLSIRTAALLRSAVVRARAALERGDVATLAALLPSSEHWRLFELFGDEASYLDIETGDDVWGHEGISAIGFLDRHGPRLLLAGRDLHHFPALARRWPLLITFNGLSFDVPILRRAFPDWTPPAAHVDLRHVLSRLGHRGGLKSIEREIASLNLARPSHLRGIDGWGACNLFRRGKEGDADALRRFAEYNLYDVVNLRTLMAHAYNQLAEREVALAPALRRCVSSLPVPGRGDVLYDVSKILLAL